ncbi:precorrin 3B synthase CobZ, partial [Teratosphaeria destructans]
MAPLPQKCDVLVIGGGNAGFCAALAATESGARDVLLIDKCPEAWAGGNTYFTAGAMRTVHRGLEDLRPLVNNVDPELARTIDLDPYTPAEFRRDLHRICAGRSDPRLSAALIDESHEAVRWLAGKGVRF